MLLFRVVDSEAQVKRYYLEITPMVRDVYGSPRSDFGVTRYLIDSEALGLPDVPQQFLAPTSYCTIRGSRGGDQFDVQFQIRVTDADAPQPESTIGRIVLDVNGQGTVEVPTVKYDEFSRLLLNSIYRKATGQ